jgi:hypothetical protein
LTVPPLRLLFAGSKFIEADLGMALRVKANNTPYSSRRRYRE